MEQMRMKHNETGRSMVEMLGVLAVVGVLSIGGVAGYRYAVDKMNANEIINELKKRAITASQQRVLGQDINLAEYGENAKIKGTYTVIPTKNYDGNASQFALEVAGVPERVCDMILESDWAMPTEMAVNGGSCVEGANGNTMTFAFNNTLGSGDAGNGGNNDPTDTPTQQCSENEYQVWDGTCQLDTNCSDPNQFYNAHYDVRDCVPCPTEGNAVENNGSDLEDSCTKCLNSKLGNNLNAAGSVTYCVYCPSNRVVCGDQCCGEGQQCRVSYNWPYTYTCVDGFKGNECLTNDDCNKDGKTGYYCKNTIGCPKMMGICEPASMSGESVEFFGTTLYRSQDEMGWFAAQNFCSAHGMKLFEPELKNYCTEEEWTKFQKATDGWGQCEELRGKVPDLSWTAIESGYCTAVAFQYSSLQRQTTLDYSRYALCEGEGGYVPPVVSTETTTQTETTTTTATQTQTDTSTDTSTISNPEVTATVSGENPWEEVSCDEENVYPLFDGTCVFDGNCSDPNQFYNGKTGECTACPTEGNPVKNDASDIEDSCTKCTNAQQGYDRSNASSYCVWCPSNRVVCEDTCCEAGELCKRNDSTYQYECVSGLDSTKNECLTNADCNNGSETGDYYCKNAGGCTQTIGTCERATLDNNGASIDFHGKSVYRSEDSMSWDAAKNFCAAHNMSLFNPKPYCTADEWSSIQSNDDGYCTTEENNLAVTNDYNWYGWTGSASGFCTAFSVDLSNGYVDNLYTPYYNIAALCVK